MNPIITFFCKVHRSLKTRLYHKIYMPFLLSEAKECGTDVVIGPDNHIAGIENMEFGNHVYIGPGGIVLH